jgi:hypothetical protein
MPSHLNDSWIPPRPDTSIVIPLFGRLLLDCTATFEAFPYPKTTGEHNLILLSDIHCHAALQPRMDRV